MSTVELRLGRFGRAVHQRLEAWSRNRVARRLWDRDHTLWSPTPAPELEDRLGWLELPRTMVRRVTEINALAAGVVEQGAERVLLLGMGGSSLAPEVFQRCLGNREGFPKLEVLDSTHPAAVTAAAATLEPERTHFVVASKSGGTLETLSLFRFFWQRMSAAVERPGDHFVAITDPGSSLESLGRDRRFRAVVTAPPDVGGRYSALSPFGLVPAALIGLDLEELLTAGAAMAELCARDEANPGLELGAVVGELALAGRDKLTFLTSPTLEALPDWIEQLVAESTGKDGVGIVPVVGEPLGSAEVYGDDRLFVSVRLVSEADPQVDSRLEHLEAAGHPVVRVTLDHSSELAGEMFRWEVATAAASVILGIHPFNQPDVQLAKELARRAMASSEGEEATEEDRPSSADGRQLGDWLAGVGAGEYVAVQAFLAPTGENLEALARLQGAVRERCGAATTVGLGPRFLHSTGQLHKGGPDSGWFLQLVDRPEAEVAVPETDYGFARLITAQARGDAGALRQRGRRVLILDLGRAAAPELDRLSSALV